MKRHGRKLIVLSNSETSKINLLYYVNERNLTEIAKIMHRSPPVCYRHIFKTKDEWSKWYDEKIAAGEL